MAQDNDPWRRFRSRQLEKKGTSLSTAKTRAIQGTVVETVIQDGNIDFEALFKKLEILMSQLSNLYNQYVAGVEKQPPIERRKQFDTLLNFLVNTPKPTMNVRFKAQTLATQAQTQAERWEKLLRKLEAGDMKRRMQKRAKAG